MLRNTRLGTRDPGGFRLLLWHFHDVVSRTADVAVFTSVVSLIGIVSRVKPHAAFTEVTAAPSHSHDRVLSSFFLVGEIFRSAILICELAVLAGSNTDSPRDILPR